MSSYSHICQNIKFLKQQKQPKSSCKQNHRTRVQSKARRKITKYFRVRLFTVKGVKQCKQSDAACARAQTKRMVCCDWSCETVGIRAWGGMTNAGQEPVSRDARVQNSKNMALITEDVDLEKEYSPSRWSNRFPTPHAVLQNHVDLVTAASEKAVNRIPHKLEIEYGSTPGQKLDILGTNLPNDSPILVFVHGGYWQELSREMSRYPAGPLHQFGIKTIVVGYDLCPSATLPEIVNQIQNAANFIFEYAEKMGSRGVYFSGHSAGAHLVSKLLSNADFLENTPGSQRLQGAFLISGIYDLRELVHTSINDAIQLPEEWAAAMSPMFDDFTHLQARKIRVFILAGQNDSPTFKKQSREFFELLHNTCLMQHMFLEIKDEMDHFDIVECFAKDDNYLRNLLVHDIRKNL